MRPFPPEFLTEQPGSDSSEEWEERCRSASVCMLLDIVNPSSS